MTPPDSPATAAEKTAMVILTRDPGGPLTGGKTILRTTIRSLTTLGYGVIAVVVGPLEDDRWLTDHCLEVVGLGRPRRLRVALNIVRYFSVGRLSLNECLYVSGAVRRAVRDTAERRRVTFVVADMIRTFELAMATERPVLVDLVDLLSERYAALRGEPVGPVLGYISQDVSRGARLVELVLRRLLRLEQRVLARREVAVARRATSVALVCAAEADRLSESAGIHCLCLPMAVDEPPVGANPSAAPPDQFLFVGSIDYRPNYESLSWFVKEVLPQLRSDLTGFRLDVAGHLGAEVPASLQVDGLRFLGYVQDLDQILSRYRGMLAPVVSGTGVKNKVLDGLAAGLPVVATSLGFEDINVVPGVSGFLAGTATEWVAAVLALAADGAGASAVGRNGREIVRETFSSQVVTERWREAVHLLEG